jgi:hypothetical protein
MFRPALWSSGQSFWQVIMRSRVRFPVLPWGFFPEGEDSLCDHGLCSLVEPRFKAPPGTSYSYITIHLIGQHNCASWASQPQTSVTLRPQPGGETTKSIRDMWYCGERGNVYVYQLHGRCGILTFWLRDASTSLTFSNCTFCPHCIYVLCKQRLVPLTA